MTWGQLIDPVCYPRFVDSVVSHTRDTVAGSSNFFTKMLSLNSVKTFWENSSVCDSLHCVRLYQVTELGTTRIKLETINLLESFPNT